jgi:hypothetical protein
MKALLVTLSFWVQGMPLTCKKVSKDTDGFYHFQYIDRKTNDTFNLTSDRLFHRIKGCGL